MKITTNRPPAPFTPVSITLTFESQAELDAMGKLFNIAFIANAFEELCGGERAPLYVTLQNLGADVSKPGDVYFPLFRNDSSFRTCAQNAS